MAIVPASHNDTFPDAAPAAVWPWPDNSGECHCLTLRYSTDEEPTADMAASLPPQLLRAVPKRKAEFLAGRRCAAEAIRRLTGQAVSPGMGEDRAPIWPEGVVGAISHSGDRAIALAGAGGRFCGIGIDIEKLLSEEEAGDIATQTLTNQELHSLGNVIDPFMTGLIFSAKESLFKALYPTVKRLFFFEAAELSAYDENGSGALRLTADLDGGWRKGTEVPFRFGHFEGLLLTRVLLPH
ncbi:4'-phosphopantetheinyl transferase [Agrobacterium rhizogenes]|uniref:4'-phosphopantetheinyl transferase family protein n=1 Tax=Rhizobium rhizogenes TaxID=359 RepID=UPI0022B72634|nr:4'-phosphopantetheinyl transferase [Rhizobium rhizogenes]MCZ7447001.1 4'-phosphopantetheinyl transferase [Rhizobium rhizogenes]